MKKLIAIFAILIFAAPALAADWAFYGQARFKTFWEQKYRHDTPTDGDAEWNLQNNSRLGADVKADKVIGKVELALKSTDKGDETVSTRLIWGQWNFADKMFLKVGKHAEIIDMTDISNMVYNVQRTGDSDLTGFALSTSRMGAITLGIGGFQLSLVEPTTSLAGTTDNGITVVDKKIPKINALYTLMLDKASLRFGGGYQYLEVSDDNGQASEVHSYVLATAAKVPIGAFYINGVAFYGQNMTAANWNNGGLGQNDQGSNVSTDTDGDVDDTTSYGVAGAMGLNFTDTIQFETGAGWHLDDNGAAPSGEEAFWNAYVQMTYKFAPNCKITPEIGYISRQDENTGLTGGHDWYAGMQWRLDF